MLPLWFLLHPHRSGNALAASTFVTRKRGGTRGAADAATLSGPLLRDRERNGFGLTCGNLELDGLAPAIVAGNGTLDVDEPVEAVETPAVGPFGPVALDAKRPHVAVLEPRFGSKF